MCKTSHAIEQGVVVYLEWGDDGWEVDLRTFDDAPLETADGTDLADNSECYCDDPEECADLAQQATDAGFPTGHQLAEMLAEAAKKHKRRSEFDSGLTVEDFAVGDLVRVESRGGVVGTVGEIIYPKDGTDRRPELIIHPHGLDCWRRFWNLPSQCVKIEPTEEG